MEEKKEDKGLESLKKAKEAIKGKVTGLQLEVEIEKLIQQYHRLKESRVKNQLQKELDDVRNMMEKETVAMDPMPMPQQPQPPLQL